LGVACALLIVTFRSSDRLAAAYGLAVSVTMMATSIAFYLVVSRKFGWSQPRALVTLAGFLVLDGSFVLACLPKFLDGGYVPVAICAALTCMALTWLEGRRCVARSVREQIEPISQFLNETVDQPLEHASGTMVFLSGDPDGIPFMANHRWLRARAHHERIVVLTLARSQGPYADVGQRVKIERLSDRLVRVLAHFGYMEAPRLAVVIAACETLGLKLDDPETSFFYADAKLIGKPGGMPAPQRWLFGLLTRNSRPLPDDLQIPADRRVELGLEVAI
jgi:KUP system potassium uptake protein